MTIPQDPPLVRQRAGIGALRSQAVFTLGIGLVAVAFAVGGLVNGQVGWVMVAAGIVGVGFTASAVVGLLFAQRRLRAFEQEHGVGAGTLRRPSDGAAASETGSTGASEASLVPGAPGDGDVPSPPRTAG